MTTPTRQEMPVKALADLLREYADRLGEPDDAGYPTRTEIGEALSKFADLFEIAHDPEQRADITDRDVREDTGMCPDGEPHWYGSPCRPHECPTWREAESEDAADERAHRGW